MVSAGVGRAAAVALDLVDDQQGVGSGVNTGRLIGIVLIVVGVGAALIAGVWLALQASNQQLGAGGAVLGAGLAFIPIALLVGFGVFLFIRGGKEVEHESAMLKQRKLLDILKSRGQVSVSDMALELGVNAATVQELVHQLVGLQVFSGYANWKDGMLFSAEASQLRQIDKCRNCGGEISLVGKGTAQCRFCDTEYFLT